ncbi:MAG: prepilin-type N-terminal cleavage/methylation domain-containing protein [Candidatus Omnitrophota bacterium]|nr:prepilin-type N-terminal cleavage/methylation domain-containing protein [Candidatus Omnitrophota bacterium]
MKKGFTLMELVVVIIIIGILAMIGFPQFLMVAERGRASEGVNVLGILKSSQLRYATEHSTTATDIDSLDMQPPNLRYFTMQAFPAALDPYDHDNVNSVVATVQRNNIDNISFGSYALSIAVNGSITCAPGNESSNICQALGYAAAQ